MLGHCAWGHTDGEAPRMDPSQHHSNRARSPARLRDGNSQRPHRTPPSTGPHRTPPSTGYTRSTPSPAAVYLAQLAEARVIGHTPAHTPQLQDSRRNDDEAGWLHATDARRGGPQSTTRRHGMIAPVPPLGLSISEQSYASTVHQGVPPPPQIGRSISGQPHYGIGIGTQEPYQQRRDNVVIPSFTPMQR
ncbi:hypothetical protein C8Q78DRAFT_8302 [Trametes maxima]|nr:hypothetical protein C8Q78DRAFT_8302 [Trametes maxima]